MSEVVQSELTSGTSQTYKPQESGSAASVEDQILERDSVSLVHRGTTSGESRIQQQTSFSFRSSMAWGFHEGTSDTLRRTSSSVPIPEIVEPVSNELNLEEDAALVEGHSDMNAGETTIKR
jgi:hypothetical protein